MNYLRFETLGQLAVTLGLVVSCGGDVRDLGNDRVTATGGAGFETGGNSTTGGSSAVETGGSAAVETGGSATATGGSGIVDIHIGGWLSTGGQSNTGGQNSTGGQSSVTPYVTDPTLPIDPSCTCDSSDNICNAAGECVPRCDESGRCARWLANRAVRDLLVEGSSLFYVVAATTDPLGNPDSNGALYRVETSGGTPTQIVGGLGDPGMIVGRYNNTTFMTAGAGLVSVSDSGVVATLAQCREVAMWGHWIAYIDPSGLTLMGIDLDATLEPVVLAQPTPTTIYRPTLALPVVLDESILYQTWDTEDSSYMCMVQLSNLELAPSCVRSGWYPDDTLVSSGDQFYGASGYTGQTVNSFAPPNTYLKKLFESVWPTWSGDDFLTISVRGLAYANGWLYMNLTGSSTHASTRFALLRVPSNVGRLPQDVLPEALVTRQNATYESGLQFSVGASDIFWVQYAAPWTTQVQPQYIFSAPLPPQPCDADLPCADSTLTCTNGFCGAA